jgi:hypothetical protein
MNINYFLAANSVLPQPRGQVALEITRSKVLLCPRKQLFETNPIIRNEGKEQSIGLSFGGGPAFGIPIDDSSLPIVEMGGIALPKRPQLLVRRSVAESRCKQQRQREERQFLDIYTPHNSP